MKQKHYRLTNIKKLDAEYNILLGERSNGKSYSVKEECLINAYKSNDMFGYMRRYQFDVKSSDVEAYFSDMPITSYTNGEYETISVYRGRIYFANYTNDFKIVRGKMCGYIFYLSGLEHFKSQAFNTITTLIFEEFITKRQYLDNEPALLQQFVSTIARRRRIHVYMIGNTINRLCPYFTEWSLRNIPKQKQGTIETYNFKTDQVDENLQPITIKIAVEFCENSGNNSKMFFGNVGKNITSGTWECEEVPHLPTDIDYVKLYEFLLSDFGFSFVVQLLRNPQNNGLIVYVYPYTYKRKVNRVVTSVFSDEPLTSCRLFDNIEVEKHIKWLINNNKICYSDNLCGSDFKQVLLNRKGGI